MTSSTGGGGNWPFERVAEGASPVGGATVGRSGPGPERPGAERPVAPSGFSGPASERAARAGGADDDRRAGGSGPVGTGGAAGSGGRSAAGRSTAKRRRPPVWLLVVIGLVVVGGVVAAILLLTNQEGETPEAPPAETVTLPVPTPTVTPIAREGGTAFQTALPSTVLAFALSEVVEHEPLLVGGAVEAWKATYTDGAQTVVLYAGQYRDAATADAAFAAVLAQNPVDAGAGGAATKTETETETEEGADAEGDDATGTPDAPAFEPEQGTVEVDGAQVGRFLFIPREGGTASLWWTNTTVLLQLEGPAAAVRDLYTAFPL